MQVNGAPACSNTALLKTLRQDWGFEGYVTSDSGACNLITASHHYTNDTVHAAAACLEGGTDINSGFVYLHEIEHGVSSGVIPEEAVRTALRNAYGFRMRLGLFNPDNTTEDKNRDIPVTAIGAAEHKEASLDAARQVPIHSLIHPLYSESDSSSSKRS